VSSLIPRSGVERRRGDRRQSPRGGFDRRRGDRRRAYVRHLLFTTLGLVAPSNGGWLAALPPIEQFPTAAPVPIVTASIVSVTAIPGNRAYTAIIAEAEGRYDVDAALIRSVMQAESAYNPLAVSPAGALGLMQLMPELAAEYGVEDPFDPRENIMAGARYLRWLLDRHDGNVGLALASYNAGPGAVTKYGGIPPFRETRNYVVRVTHLLERVE
jgi:soluble lytic murein transglycosylase-like protein